MAEVRREGSVRLKLARIEVMISYKDKDVPNASQRFYSDERAHKALEMCDKQGRFDATGIENRNAEGHVKILKYYPVSYNDNPIASEVVNTGVNLSFDEFSRLGKPEYLESRVKASYRAIEGK